MSNLFNEIIKRLHQLFGIGSLSTLLTEGIDPPCKTISVITETQS